MTVEGRILERLVGAAERYDVAWHPIEFKRLIMAAVAAASLQEVATGTARMPKKVQWIAMSCRPKESASWQVIEVGDLPSDRSVSTPFAVSESVQHDLQEVVQALEQEKSSPKISFLTPLRVAPPIPVESIPETNAVYVRCSPMRLPDSPSAIFVAWLVGVSEEMEATEEARVDSSLVQAERIVSDRLLYGFGGYRPAASILASIDESFRHSLETARSATGLLEFLDLLETGGVRPPQHEQETVRQHEPESAVGTPFTEADIEGFARKIVEEIFGQVRSEVFLNVAKNGMLKTPFGEWHGMVEFGGVIGFRSKKVLVSLCGTCDRVESAIAKYLAATRGANDVQLAILLYGQESRHREQHEKAWTKVGGIRFGTMQ